MNKQLFVHDIGTPHLHLFDQLSMLVIRLDFLLGCVLIAILGWCLRARPGIAVSACMLTFVGLTHYGLKTLQ